MIVIGAVLLVLAALGTVAAVVTGRDTQVHLSGFGVDVTTNVLWVYSAGALAMLLLLLAFSAFRRAARRARNQRRELKQQRADLAAATHDRTAGEGAVDVRDSDAAQADAPDGDGAHAYRNDAEDPGPERRYIPGEERVK